MVSLPHSGSLVETLLSLILWISSRIFMRGEDLGKV